MKKFLYFFVFACLAHDSANGGELSNQSSFGSDLRCPESVFVDQKIINAPSTWGAINLDADKRHQLVSASMFSGHPSLMAQLRESGDFSDLNKRTRMLKFSSLAVHKNTIYFVCNYEATGVVVFKEISPHPNVCSIIFQRGHNGFESIRAVCQ